MNESTAGPGSVTQGRFNDAVMLTDWLIDYANTA